MDLPGIRRLSDTSHNLITKARELIRNNAPKEDLYSVFREVFAMAGNNLVWARTSDRGIVGEYNVVPLSSFYFPVKEIKAWMKAESVPRVPELVVPGVFDQIAAKFTTDDKIQRIPMTTSDGQVVRERHLGFSDKIESLVQRRSYLIDQFHLLKCKIDKDSDKIYTDLLYNKRTPLTSFDTWPCIFQSAMDSLWHDDLRKVHSDYTDMDVGNLYYRACYRVFNVNVQARRDGFVFTEHPVVSTEDIAMLVRHNEEVIAFMKQIAGMTRNVTDSTESKAMQKEIERVQAIVDKYRPA
jgi:hypothetical protein